MLSLLRYSAENDIEPAALHTVASDSESCSDTNPDSRCIFVATDAKADSDAIDVEVSAGRRGHLHKLQ